MVQREDILIKLIDWAYQSIFNWIGVGVASLIGLFEIDLKKKKLLSIYSLFYCGFIITFLFAVQKVLEHWKFIQSNRSELIAQYGWPSSGATQGFLTKTVDSFLRLIVSNPYLGNLFLILIAYIGIEFFREKRNQRPIITTIFEGIREKLIKFRSELFSNH